MSRTIAVQSSVSNVRKFLEVSNVSKVEVCTPLGMISKSISISIPKDTENIDEIEDKDLCFIVCESPDQRDTISGLLDEYGFDLPPFEVELEHDEGSDQDIEDIIKDVEGKNYMFNHARSLDFVGRISETAALSIGEFDFDIDGLEEDEEELEEEVINSLTAIIDTATGNIFPKMLPNNASTLSMIFIPETEYLDIDAEDMGMMTTIHRVNFDEVKPIKPGRASMNFSKVNDGRYLIVDNAFVLSAIEGVVPGYIVVVFEQDGDGDKDNPMPSVAMWRISHNWVEGLSHENVKNNSNDLLDGIMAAHYGKRVDVKLYATGDIPIPEYPFLSPSMYSKDIAILARDAIEEAEAGLAEDDGEES